MASTNRTRQDKKSYSFTMTSTDVIWTCVGAVVALTVFFLFGILVGRGYLPTEPGDAAVAEVQLEASQHGQLTGGDQLAEADKPEPAPPAPEVLKPEELAYQDQLDKPAETVEEAEAAAQKTADDAKKAAQKPTPDEPSQETAVVEAKEAGEAAPGMYDPDNLPAPEPGETVNQYTYQAAAFKDEAAATELANKLKERGLPAKVVKGVTTSATWYRVRIPFTGTPSQTRPMRELVKSITGQKPVMVSKKAK